VLPGDYNRNGTVDAADYILLRKGDMAADGNGSLHIDPVDFMIWEKNFGRTMAGSGGAVPEPGTMLLTMLGLISLSAIRRRR
jgi:hypothetical protein